MKKIAVINKLSGLSLNLTKALINSSDLETSGLYYKNFMIIIAVWDSGQYYKTTN